MTNNKFRDNNDSDSQYDRNMQYILNIHPFTKNWTVHEFTRQNSQVKENARNEKSERSGDESEIFHQNDVDDFQSKITHKFNKQTID